jgi:hypothetical protein
LQNSATATTPSPSLRRGLSALAATRAIPDRDSRHPTIVRSQQSMIASDYTSHPGS